MIDLSAAGAGGADFNLFYGIDIHTSGTNCLVSPGSCTIAPYSTPGGGADEPSGTNPNAGAWELTEDLATSCTGGATLSPYDIGLNNNIGTGVTTIEDTGTVAIPAINNFYADDRNIPNTPIGPNLIRATFSIAN